MTCREQNNSIHPAITLLAEQGFEGMAEVMTVLLNEAMQIERAQHLQAQPYERSQERQGYANGYKAKTVNTRVGKLKLAVPQVRDSDYYPAALDKGLRSERALKLAVAEMYVQGVATRKVKAITEQLCGFEISSTDVSRASQQLDDVLRKWRERSLGRMVYLIVDARYEKVRQGGCVVDSAVLIAYGIDEAGKRHILGTSVSLSEHEVHWREFLQSLSKRGLHGLKLIISDAHAGLAAARKAVFPGVAWQRCQFHLQQNAQAYVPKKSMKKAVAADIRSIFNAPGLEESQRLLGIMANKHRDSAPELAQWMEKNIPEGLVVMTFPVSHQIRLRTSNMAERVNKEVRRRTRVATLFPNVESCLRLVSAVLMEIDEEWQVAQAYLPQEERD